VVYASIIERSVAEHHLIRDHTKAPTIGALVVTALIHLGSHVLDGTDDLSKHFASPRHRYRGVEVQDLDAVAGPVLSPKGEAVGVDQADVLGLEVSMHPALLVDIFQAMQDLAQQKARVVLGQPQG
jgi:hypothetical protein